MGEAIGKSNGELTSKIHAVTDGNGHAMNFIITGGNTHDCTQAKNLIASIVGHVLNLLKTFIKTPSEVQDINN